MIKQYIQQALFSIREHKLQSAITIIGTALSICLIMVLFLMQYLKVAPLSPENKRDRILIVSIVGIGEESKSGNSSMTGPINHNLAKRYVSEMKTPEVVSIVSPYHATRYISNPISKKGVDLNTKQVDANFFRLIDYTFVNGTPFTQEQEDSDAKVVLLSEKSAQVLFGSVDVVDQFIEIDFIPFRITGVYKDVSALSSWAYADVLIPFAHQIDYTQLIAGYGVYTLLLAKDKSDFPKIKEEFKERMAKAEADYPNTQITFANQPDPIEVSLERYSYTTDPDMTQIRLKQLLLVLILLLVPAINLSAISQSRLRNRLAEIGVRRAFGGRRVDIIVQFLIESLVLTFIGGVIGLGFSWLAIASWSDILLNADPEALRISLQVIFSATVISIAFFFCLLMNLLSSGIPAWRAGKANIVNALNKQ
ncbi:MAG TPA: hypothetical protein DCF91_00195 [Porphyromonadaceae bacterium]|nr:hypothetical protein [Porphyromonadaceae bacterium]